MKLTTKIIANKVIEVTGCDIREVNRTRDYVMARLIYSKLCMRLLDVTLRDVGEQINRGHDTIIYYNKEWANPYRFQESSKQLYKTLKAGLLQSHLRSQFEPEERNYVKELSKLTIKYTRVVSNNKVSNKSLKFFKSEHLKLVEDNLILKKKVDALELHIAKFYTI